MKGEDGHHHGEEQENKKGFWKKQRGFMKELYREHTGKALVCLILGIGTAVLYSYIGPSEEDDAEWESRGETSEGGEEDHIQTDNTVSYYQYQSLSLFFLHLTNYI